MPEMTAEPDSQPHQKIDRFEKERLRKVDQLIEMGIDPWGQRFDGHIPISRCRELAPAESGQDGEQVRAAGRIMRRRKAGKLRFYDIQDATGQIQLLVSRGDVSDEQWALLSALDLGDLIGVDGPLRLTDTGEISIFVEKITVLCKSLAQPPEKFHGAKDTEMLLRQRYIDLIYNPGVVERMQKRSRIIASVRQTLGTRDFLEVETPVLHAIAGGAAARPFITHHNTRAMPLFLRIALELHLKRLMVGGIERVFELGRVFRNEGIDATHNPEFTMIEIYQAYGDYASMMELTEAIVCDAVKSISESLSLQWCGSEIDFTPPWPRLKYADLLQEHAGCQLGDEASLTAKARELGIPTENVHLDVLANELFEATVEDKLMGPAFVIDYPASICPLTKRKTDNPAIAERFELFVQGMELANAYTELNDPKLQEQLFQTQLAGLSDEDSMARMDHDFVRALKVGMPPAGGLGIGIDRLVMLLTDTRTIRDVIFFPLLRPEGQAPATADGANSEGKPQ